MGSNLDEDSEAEEEERDCVFIGNDGNEMGQGYETFTFELAFHNKRYSKVAWK